MKIYTKRGDEGKTGLFGGQRVSKDDLRVAAYGDVDEVNASVGLARAVVTDDEVDGILARTQSELFDLGAEAATPPESSESARARVTLITSQSITRMEEEIDRFSEELPPLKNFILPGGGISAATLHHSRTVCRRAERALAALHAESPLRPELLAYVNRLSDLLFILARLANHRAGLPETAWQQGAGDKSGGKGDA